MSSGPVERSVRLWANAVRKFADGRNGSGPFAVENPIRRPEKHPAGGLSVITVGPQLRDAIAPLRHPTGTSAPPECFSVLRPRGLLQGFLRERPRAVFGDTERISTCRPPHPGRTPGRTSPPAKIFSAVSASSAASSVRHAVD